jgi:hypothetical protein
VAADCSSGSYTPEPNYYGPDTFTYTVSDDSLTATATVQVTVKAKPRTLTFTPVADAYVDASHPTTNYGTLTALRVDGSPVLRTYLRFNVQGMVGTIKRARLRVFAETNQNIGHDVHGVADNAWGEQTINFNNAPSFGHVVSSSGPIGAGTWTEVNVTPLVTRDGLVSFVLTTPSTTAVRYSSRESGVNAPQLIVETQ